MSALAISNSGGRSHTIGSSTSPWNGVKVFSATMIADRERLGDKVTDWIAAHKDCELSQIAITQSSDSAFHCITITVFYMRHDAPAPRA